MCTLRVMPSKFTENFRISYFFVFLGVFVNSFPWHAPDKVSFVVWAFVMLFLAYLSMVSYVKSLKAEPTENTITKMFVSDDLIFNSSMLVLCVIFMVLLLIVFARDDLCDVSEDSSVTATSNHVLILGRTCTSSYAFFLSNVVAFTLTFSRRIVSFLLSQHMREAMMKKRTERGEEQPVIVTLDIVDQISWFIAITLLISQNVRIFISLASGSVLSRLQYINVARGDHEEEGNTTSQGKNKKANTSGNENNQAALFHLDNGRQSLHF